MRNVDTLADMRATYANLAAGMNAAGERELARKATFAAQALAAAITAVTTYQDAILAVSEQEQEN